MNLFENSIKPYFASPALLFVNHSNKAIENGSLTICVVRLWMVENWRDSALPL
jgi:hypothetical protein